MRRGRGKASGLAGLYPTGRSRVSSLGKLFIIWPSRLHSLLGSMHLQQSPGLAICRRKGQARGARCNETVIALVVRVFGAAHSRETRVKRFRVWRSTLWPINMKVKAITERTPSPCTHRLLIDFVWEGGGWFVLNGLNERRLVLPNGGAAAALSDTTCRLTCRT